MPTSEPEIKEEILGTVEVLEVFNITKVGNIVFENTTSTYQIGMNAYIKVPTSGFNNRVSGANGNRHCC